MNVLGRLGKFLFVWAGFCALPLVQPAHAGLLDAIKSVVPGDSGKAASGDAKAPSAVENSSPVFDLGNPAKPQVENYVKAYGLDKLKGKRLAITSFGIEFNRKMHHHAVDRNIITDTYSNATTDFLLDGVPDEVMQRIADRAYEQTVKALGAAGFELVPQETVRASAAYRTLIKGAVAQPMLDYTYKVGKRFDKPQDVTSTIVAPAGLVYYEPEMDEDEERGPAGDNVLSVMGNMRLDRATRKVRINEVETAKSLDAGLLKVRMVIGFGEASASTYQYHTIHTDYIKEEVYAKLSTRNGHKTRSQLSVLGKGESYFGIRLPDGSLYGADRSHVSTGNNGLLSKMIKGTVEESRDGNVTVWLSESIRSGDNFLAADVNEATSAKQEQDNKSSSGMASAFAKLGQFVGTSQGKSFAAHADPELYEYLASAHLDAAVDMLAAKLGAGK